MGSDLHRDGIRRVVSWTCLDRVLDKGLVIAGDIATSDAEKREVFISVQDTGIGIAEQDRDKVFEDFRQADRSVTREYGGAGLGLSICRRLAAILGGRIELHSRLGQGSTFTLVIPRRGKRR